MEEFHASEYMVRRARQLQHEQCILPDVPTKKGQPLSQETLKQVEAFFYEDNISRMRPGAKDYKSVREGGVRVQKQKRLLLMNLNEAYQVFKTKNPELRIGISKFCELRPTVRNVLVLEPKEHIQSVCAPAIKMLSFYLYHSPQMMLR